MSLKKDVAQLEHALFQIEYAKAGGKFTDHTRNVLYELIQRLRRVISREKQRSRKRTNRQRRQR